LTTRACTNRSMKSGPRMRIIGMRWIPNCRSSRSTRRANERILARNFFGRSR
jgi:hypothetical protein